MRFVAQSSTDKGTWPHPQVLRIGEAIRALRGRRSAQWLSDETAKLGEHVGRSTITDIEIGRRKYVAVHELSVIAAALGVSPAALLTHGSMPDGDVEFLPGRAAPAHEVAAWWGGSTISPFRPSGQGLPPADDATKAMFLAVRERSRLQSSRIKFVGAETKTDAEKDADIRRQVNTRLAALNEQIRALGGVLDEGGDRGAG
jgi:hypothetical protein